MIIHQSKTPRCPMCHAKIIFKFGMTYNWVKLYSKTNRINTSLVLFNKLYYVRHVSKSRFTPKVNPKNKSYDDFHYFHELKYNNVFNKLSKYSIKRGKNVKYVIADCEKCGWRIDLYTVPINDFLKEINKK